MQLQEIATTDENSLSTHCWYSLMTPLPVVQYMSTHHLSEVLQPKQLNCYMETYIQNLSCPVS